MFTFDYKKQDDVVVQYVERRVEQDLYEYDFTFQQTELKEFTPVTVKWELPLIDAHYLWFPINGVSRKLRMDTHPAIPSKATVSAPVSIMYNADDRNRITCAVSEAMTTVQIGMGVREENGHIICRAVFFTEPTKPAKEYKVTIRIDLRDIPYYKSLSDVAKWWETYPIYEPASVPEVAKQPMYSTWYSFHQVMTDKEIEEQCMIAKELGCEAVIVDDGWQTADNQRGYAFTGDWEVCEGKFPDMKAHVERVHQMGMKYLLWYSVPYIGVNSKIYDTYKDKTLFITERNSSATLDPRYKDVREYLIKIYEDALVEWNLDGFKLDFVDRFGFSHDKEFPPVNDEMDHDSVDEAVDTLLSEVMQRLRKIKPDIMVEFRQKYIGPLMRKYGNIFRVGDCPADYATNRQGICDIRLLCEETVAHSDMIMWYKGDKVESAALQINNIIFGVPQVSMDLNVLTDEHKEMLTFWLDFFNQNRQVLLGGEFIPHHPEQMYPIVEAKTADKHIVGVYADHVVTLDDQENKTTTLVNGKLTTRIFADFQNGYKGEMQVLDCCGKIVETKQVEFAPGVQALEVPASGLVILK